MSAAPRPLVQDEAVAPDSLPLMLQRPDDRGAIARLTMTKGTESGAATERWMLKGSPLVIDLAAKLFSGVTIADARRSASFPAVVSCFADLLMLMHRHPVTIGTTARELWNEHYSDLIASWETRCGFITGAPKGGGGRFKGTLREFQVAGLTFLDANRKSLLADDMGLGKTPVALALLDRIDDWPAVVVCQPHVQRHWERKIEEFLDSRETSALPLGFKAGAKPPVTWRRLAGINPARDATKADLYLTHYLIVGFWENWLKARGVRTVIFDEAQELRNSGTRKYQACRSLARSAKNVAGLSGTPIYNKGAEIYSVMNAINRGCFGTMVDFQRNWCNPYDIYRVEAPEALGQYLCDRGLMLRRRKEEVLSELPEKRRVIEMVDADNAKFAELLKEAVKLASDAAFINNPFDRARMESEALAMTRLATGVAKAPGVVAFLRALLEADQPTLVFAHHHAVHDTILEALESFQPASVTGRETIAMKDRSQQRFMAGETNLCLIALRAATGLDGLQQRARVVVFAELDWSPAVHWQAEDRAHRMGQRDSVLAYYLTTDLGTDPGMIAALSLKKQQFVGLMHDRGESEDDQAIAQSAAEEHKTSVLQMLRGKR